MKKRLLFHSNKGKNNPLRHSAMRRDYMSSRMRQ
uniref:Uncharacterized protein n=1 Tax=Candidatus Kentrum sp. MB TaxID=2138164 RepID=A0A450XC04_9GAMM|nr:MAG: hypothetical protein BECKMB1821I_GA0114274_1001130 [Candidatus Kentron sp. MB]